jgi:2-methylisocitrate lyase-like PEP mutase family enzyme
MGLFSSFSEPELDIPAVRRSNSSWKDTLDREGLLQLPAAHDALTAKLIERAGFPAYQVGGFALVGTHFGRPDVDLEHYGEKSRVVQDIIGGCALPVLVDCDEGYGDPKNVTRVVRGYEALGASALFIEDQTTPKKCGHMAGKTVVPAEQMIAKVRAAVAARQRSETFILARTDAIESEGVESAIRRAEAYVEAGADGVYVEGPRSEKEIEQVGRALRGVKLATSVMERGGVTPWLSPDSFRELGYSMILYPTTILFRIVKAIEQGVETLRQGLPLDVAASIDRKHFEEIIEMEKWGAIEDRFSPSNSRPEPQPAH